MPPSASRTAVCSCIGPDSPSDAGSCDGLTVPAHPSASLAPKGPMPTSSVRRTGLGLPSAPREKKNTDIWIFDVARGVRTRLTSDPEADIGPK
jgi:hypothetical protein